MDFIKTNGSKSFSAYKALWLFSMVFLTGQPGLASSAVAQSNPTKAEWIQFSSLFSMEESGYMSHDMLKLDALRRARQLNTANFSYQDFRKAAAAFQPVARLYHLSNRNLSKTEGTPEEAGLWLIKLLKTKDEDSEEFLLDVLKDSQTKILMAQAIEQAETIARVAHARLWKPLVPLAAKFCGNDNSRFPFRFADRWFRNAYGKPLTNVTLVIETNSSKELPDSDRTHVLFFEKLYPDEEVSFPHWLVSKLPASNKACFRCSVWSDQVHFENVVFDKKKIDRNRYSDGYPMERTSDWGFFPAEGFTSEYDDQSPWIRFRPWTLLDYRLSMAPHDRTLGYNTEWRGTLNKNLFSLKLFYIRGDTFYGCCNYGPECERSLGLITGKIRDQHLEWEFMDDPELITRAKYQGRVNGDQIEIQHDDKRVSSKSFVVKPYENRVVNLTIEGPWLLVYGEHNGQELTKSEIGDARMYATNNTTGRMTIKLDRSVINDLEYRAKRNAPLMTIDYKLKKGERLGIWKYENGVFTVCLAQPNKARPTEFATHAGKGEYLLSWERWHRR